MPFATPADVLELTAVSVDTSQVSQAEALIRLYTEVPSDPSVNDTYFLKLAVSYQTAYMGSHPEIFSLMDVESMVQGDLNVSFRANGDAARISALARKSLSRMSANKGRVITVLTDFTEDYYNEDDRLSWASL